MMCTIVLLSYEGNAVDFLPSCYILLTSKWLTVDDNWLRFYWFSSIDANCEITEQFAEYYAISRVFAKKKRLMQPWAKSLISVTIILPNSFSNTKIVETIWAPIFSSHRQLSWYSSRFECKEYPSGSSASSAVASDKTAGRIGTISWAGVMSSQFVHEDKPIVCGHISAIVDWESFISSSFRTQLGRYWDTLSVTGKTG